MSSIRNYVHQLKDKSSTTVHDRLVTEKNELPAYAKLSRPISSSECISTTVIITSACNETAVAYHMSSSNNFIRLDISA